LLGRDLIVLRAEDTLFGRDLLILHTKDHFVGRDPTRSPHQRSGTRDLGR
jgi:hypothetical protein